MSLNITWSVLAKGRRSTADFRRKVDPARFKSVPDYEQIIDLLIPFGDDLFRIFQIEQIVQLMLRSDLRDRTLEPDPINLYERAILSFPEPGSSQSGSLMQVFFFDDAEITALETEGIQQLKATVDPIAQTFTTKEGSSTFTFVNGLSSFITVLPGRRIKLQGVLPVAPFSFTINYIGNLSVDWVDLTAKVDAGDFRWTDPDLRIIWQEDFNWINRISAVALLAVENSLREA